MVIYSVFSNKHKVHKKWKNELMFFKGDLSNINTEFDYRFKVVKNLREESIFLGLYTGNFPVKYPLQLKYTDDDGKEINREIQDNIYDCPDPEQGSDLS